MGGRRRWRNIAAGSLGRRIALCSVAGALTAGSLVGCATGDAVHDQFAREFSRDPAVVELDLSSADNQAFTGGVGGEVSLRDDITDAELRAFGERVREFAVDHDTRVLGSAGPSNVRISVLFDGWRVPVLLDEAQGGALLDATKELRGDSRVDAVVFNSVEFTTVVDSATIEIADGDTAFAMLAESPGLFAQLAPSPTLTVTTRPGAAERVVLAGAPGPWLDSARASYDALTAQLALTGFEADQETATVRLANEADLARAEALARAALQGSTLAVTFQSDLVTLFPGATGGAARALLAELPENARAALESVWTDDRALKLGATDRAAVAALARAIDGAGAGGAGGGAEPLGPVTIHTGDPSEPALSIQGAPGQLVAQATVGVALSARGEVARVALLPGSSLELALEERPTQADLADYAAALKPLAEPGDRVCIDAVSGGSFCVIAAPQLSDAELNDRAKRAGAPFIEAWNERP